MSHLKSEFSCSITLQMGTTTLADILAKPTRENPGQVFNYTSDQLVLDNKGLLLF